MLFGVGGFLLSHNLPVAVPSALAGLASGFGMGPGVSLLLGHRQTLEALFVPGCWCCVRYCVVDASNSDVIFCLGVCLFSNTLVGFGVFVLVY